MGRLFAACVSAGLLSCAAQRGALLRRRGPRTQRRCATAAAACNHPRADGCVWQWRPTPHT
eukprot:3815253-Pleurochrysis_carterae.AAC.1